MKNYIRSQSSRKQMVQPACMIEESLIKKKKRKKETIYKDVGSV